MAKLYGANEMESNQIDMIVGAVLDTNKNYSTAVNTIKDEAEKKAKVEAYFKDEFPRWCGQLTAVLKANGGDWFVGKSISYADISFYHYFEKLSGASAGSLNSFPELKALLERVAARPAIAAWLKARPVTAF